MRGEHCHLDDGRPWVRGSSPHARGARRGEHVGQHRQGIIPACAGSTTFWRPARRTMQDHPRMRGEHARHARLYAVSSGSSPHARGARCLIMILIVILGIIPACAGSTSLLIACSPLVRDHPRMRGEHVVAHCLFSFGSGSSPHARGARENRFRDFGFDGIIPACAGSTSRNMSTASRNRDHPRMRGEHAGSIRVLLNVTGSSPHARGAPIHHAHDGRDAGIIPACAGSTQWRSESKDGIGDHPRMRGEHPPRRPRLSHDSGSSPHARGALDLCVLGLKLLGIIPACAGSTTPQSFKAVIERDHPRMRGEHKRPHRPRSEHMGSSPHARGAQ